MLEQPTRSNDIGSEYLGPAPQFAIGRDQSDLLVSCLRCDLDERVVTASRSMNDSDTVGRATLDAPARLAFQDHDDRWDEPSGFNGRSKLSHERPSCSGSVPPPAGRTRPHHIGCVDKEHFSSLIDPAHGAGSALPKTQSIPALAFATLTRLGRNMSKNAQMAFGQQSGPPASATQLRELLALLKEAGHSDFRDARGPMGFTQRQGGGKFTRDEADTFITQLQNAESAGDDSNDSYDSNDATPGWRESAQLQTVRALPSDLLAGELRRRGWTATEP